MKTHSEELLHFVTVVTSGSISAAAHQLGLTPSAVSRSLSRLEEKLATTLINRTTRRMELTEEGRFFAEGAGQILRQLDDLEERLSIRRQTPAGRLRVDAALPFMLHAVVPHIGDFRERYPDVELELTTNDLNIDLLEERTDIAIRIGPLDDSSLHARPLCRVPLHMVASPAYLGRHGIPEDVAALRRHSLLGFTQPSALNVWPVRHGGGESLPIAPALVASSGETLRHLALSGQGIACLGHFMVHADLASGTLVELLPEAMTGYHQPVHAVYYRNTQLALRIECFLDFFQERLGAEQAV